MRVYSKVFDVVQDDLDELNHVNNVRYVEWIQEISKLHWLEVTTEAIRKEMVWVVKNHNISYRKSAILGDIVKINTYIKSNNGPISTRIVEIMDNKTGKILVNASTEWCLLDGKTFRPKRVPDSIQKLFDL